ncbi:homocysteine-responsive endoplasmic reticulum-resident ubiquitin-like domain member 1 protein isoform X1 [Notechis scutatus]|uniref:Homocysteine-responsive endoplasmic reticulum-resident ubiquitin-like domain member 1 protein isoform X1 n=1 Tax=Notechis scutatus TaxID=8663 RepID=A0A6J1VT10_9SAUR|nr:homocysteine-responsive endoplasmic reticulum-resident ubiquitin-like domain member 1 protein isoform X1 [Notechis scutatus]
MESRQAEEVEEVGLVVKSPAQRHPDLLLSARRSWSVRRLKAELRHLHPDEPPEDTQRLIYSGKLLPDHLFLQEVLTKQEAVHALHLVCNSKNLPTMPGTDVKVAEAKQQSTALGQNPSDLPGPAPSQEQVAAGPPVTTEQAGMSSPVTPPPFQAMSSSYSSYTTYHMLQLWFHQLYTRQYYMQYMAANGHSGDLSSARSSQEISVAPVTPPAPLPGPFPAENAPVEQNAPPQANPGVNQNLRMNAQGGPLMEGDDEVNRDWLDWLYSATLFYVFVNIVYFYSSMSRFLLVMAGTLLMYLHQVGWFPFRRRPAQPPPPPPDNVPVQAAINQDQNNNLQQEENPREQNEPENSEAVGENQPAPAVSFMSTAWLFFKTFFASLLPEGPPAVAN